MNFAIIVEGEKDKYAYPHIIQRIRTDASLAHPPISAGNKQKLKGTFVGFLRHLHSKRHLQLDKVLVIRDSDCRNPQPIENDLLQILQGTKFQPYFQVRFHATKCELETLLLGDVAAINRAAELQGQPGNAQPINVRLEELADPKPLFRRALSQASLRATPQVYGEIARQMNLQTVAQACPDFRRFIQKVEDC